MGWFKKIYTSARDDVKKAKKKIDKAWVKNRDAIFGGAVALASGFVPPVGGAVAVSSLIPQGSISQSNKSLKNDLSEKPKPIIQNENMMDKIKGFVTTNKSWVIPLVTTGFGIVLTWFFVKKK